MTCPNCGLENQSNFSFCTRCGTQLAKVSVPQPSIPPPQTQGSTCPSCGFTVPFGANFCPNCGTPLSAASQAPLPKPAQSAPVQQATTGITPTQPPPPPQKTEIIKPWYEKWWGLVLLVLIFGPPGAAVIWFVWKSNFAKPFKWGISVAIFLFVWYLNILLFG